MENLFGDAFEIESIENVELIETDPNIYVKRAEEELKNRRYRNAINEIDDAIKYSKDKKHYMLEKVKILNASSYAQSDMRMECINYIKNNLNIFYSELNINEFIKITEYYNDCFKQSKSNIAQVLKSKGIPYILGEGYSGEEYINRQLILNKAEEALLQERLDDALSHISIIEDKYSVDIDCLMVKGKIFKSLKDYDNAIACFSTIIDKDILEFGAILQLNITKCIKYKEVIKKVIVGAILAIIILILTQFMLFKYGILPSHVNFYDINVSNGRYIKDDVNSIVIPLDETIDIDLQYEITPFYGKLGDISYTVEDEKIISVDENNKVTALKTGETNLNVLINGKIEHTVAFSVVEATVLKQDSIAVGWDHIVGLKSDGKVVAVGNNDFGQCEVEDWRDIVSVSAGQEHTVGLKSDGTVVAVGDNGFGQCEVEDWTDIVSISAGSLYTVGLKSDGTVVAVGDNYFGQYNVGDWTDIIAISSARACSSTVGLKSDGTVVAVGSNYYGQCEVEDWTDIVAISIGQKHTVGLKSDGTIVVAGDNDIVQREATSWSDIRVDQYN